MTLSLVVWPTEAIAQPADAAISAAEAAAMADREPPPEAVIVKGDDEDRREERRGQEGQHHFALQYGVQFLPNAPGQQAMLRVRGKRDAWLGSDLRVTPGSDLAWVGRVSGGIDVLGRSNWDLDLGLSLGAAGEWTYASNTATLWATPVVGTEVGVGYDGRKLLAKYRWLGAIGAGPLDDLLSENELTVGYRVVPGFQLYGQWLVLSTGGFERDSGFGLGVRLVL